MVSRLALTAAIACLAVIAGCSALAPGDAPPEETLTPVSVSDADRASSAERDDPRKETGLGANISHVVAAHDRALDDRSYRITVRQEISADGRTIRSTTHRRWIDAGGEPYRGRLQQNSTEYPTQSAFDTVEYYSDGSVAAARYGDRQVIASDEFDSGPARDPTVQDEIVSFLRAFELQARQDEMGTVLRGTSIVAPGSIEAPVGSTDPRDGEISARFGPHGVITSLRVAYTVTIDGRPVRVTRTIRIDKVGHTTVERPPWLGASGGAADTPTPTETQPDQLPSPDT